MIITQEQADKVLGVHHTLWSIQQASDKSLVANTIEYDDKSYPVVVPEHTGYCSVLLPNPKGLNFLWITQNMNKSTYGTLAIKDSLLKGEDHRITWIIDTRNGSFSYRMNITTTFKNGIQTYGIIESYDEYGKEIIWSHNKLFVSQKAEF